MAEPRFSLNWEGHRKNICSGLSALQQNEQFVDMTLAADGHFVKVHQVIIALASPYIKDLISSANCQHPVIFLNKVSYETLCAILEYVYTGEVLISVDQLNDLVVAAKELHISGLKEMLVYMVQAQNGTSPLLSSVKLLPVCTLKLVPCGSAETKNYYSIYKNIGNTNIFESSTTNYSKMEEDIEDYLEVTEVNQDDAEKRDMVQDNTACPNNEELNTEIEGYVDDTFNDSIQETTEIVTRDETNENLQTMYINKIKSKNAHSVTIINPDSNTTPTTNVIQYTVSNRGSLQMILNRFIYYLKHSNRNNTRQWRCVDYVSGIKCPAYVVTKGDVVVQRISAHTHTFHDKRILKKVRAGAIFSAILDAEHEGELKKISNLNTNDE